MLPKEAIRVELNHMAQRRAYDNHDRLQYLGMAEPGGNESEAVWQICKYYYHGTTDRITKIKWAKGSNEFHSIWDDRNDLEYS